MKIIMSGENKAYVEKKDLVYLGNSGRSVPDIFSRYSYRSFDQLNDDDFVLVEGADAVKYIEGIEEIFDYRDYLYTKDLLPMERTKYLKENVVGSIKIFDFPKHKHILESTKDFVQRKNKAKRKLPVERVIEYSDDYKYMVDTSFAGILNFSRVDGESVKEDQDFFNFVIREMALNLGQDKIVSCYNVKCLRTNNSLSFVFKESKKKDKTFVKK